MTELDRTLRDSASAHPQPTVVPTYEGRPLAHPDEPVFDQGLLFDLETEFSRRKVLKLMGYGGLSAGLLTLAACGPSGSTSSPQRCGHQRAGDRQRAGDVESDIERRLERHRGRGRLRCDPRGDGRPVPGRWLERPERAGRQRRRPNGHHDELRRVLGHGRGPAADDPADHPGRRQQLRPDRGCGRLRLALHRGRRLLALFRGRDRGELPARRPGGRRERRRRVHEHLPGLLLRAAGRTSTSRSTRPSTPPRTRRNKIATSQIALARGRVGGRVRDDRLRGAACARSRA